MVGKEVLGVVYDIKNNRYAAYSIYTSDINWITTEELSEFTSKDKSRIPAIMDVYYKYRYTLHRFNDQKFMVVPIIFICDGQSKVELMHISGRYIEDIQ